jgi:hypothetical protein
MADACTTPIAPDVLDLELSVPPARYQLARFFRHDRRPDAVAVPPTHPNSHLRPIEASRIALNRLVSIMLLLTVAWQGLDRSGHTSVPFLDPRERCVGAAMRVGGAVSGVLDPGVHCVGTR